MTSILKFSAKPLSRHSKHTLTVHKTIFIVIVLCFLSAPFIVCAQNSMQIFESSRKKINEAENIRFHDLLPETYKSIGNQEILLHKKLIDNNLSLQEAYLYRSRVDSFLNKGKLVMRHLAKPHEDRRRILALDFLRDKNAKSFQSAEQHYSAALKHAESGNLNALRSESARADGIYSTILRSLKNTEEYQQAKNELKKIQQSVNKDLIELSSLGHGQGGTFGGDEKIVARYSRPDIMGDVRNGGLVYEQPPYFPPGEPKGPIPSEKINFITREIDLIQIGWLDKSADETTNTVLRSTSPLAVNSWQKVFETGPIESYTRGTFIDSNLTANTRYCYKILSKNGEGERSSPFNCTYTRGNTGFPIGRLRIRIKIANVRDRANDSPIRVQIGDNRDGSDAVTYLNYSHDDFEQGSEFTYDLNLGGIKDVSDITHVSIINTGSDEILVEKIDLLLNWNFRNILSNSNYSEKLDSVILYSIYFGSTRESARAIKTIGANVDAISIGYNELRASAEWKTRTSLIKSLLTSPTNFATTNLPIVIEEGNKLKIVISKEEVKSRLESAIGDLGVKSGYFDWHKDDPIRVQPNGNSAIKLNLNLKFNWENIPKIADYKFFIKDKTQIKCDLRFEYKPISSDTLLIKAFSENLDIDVDPSLGAKILGTLACPNLSLAGIFFRPYEKAFDWIENTCVDTSRFKINIEKRVALKGLLSIENFDSSQISIFVDSQGNIQICCVPK